MIILTLLPLLLPQEEGAPAPGLLHVPAGKVVAGVDVSVVEPLIQENPDSVDPLAAMIPRHTAQVEEFYIGPTEVTNEMYFRYVQATGAQPPVSWWKIDSDLRTAILKWGKETNGVDWVFDEAETSKFWDKYWQDGEWEYDGKTWKLTWEMPPERALFPVTWVNADDARAYCAWAGLRLPTEMEWTRAARGDEDWLYPYGPDFDRGKVAFNATEPRNLAAKLLPVNTLDNASPYGAVDLTGNVWELTSSGFEPFPGFKSFKVKVGRKSVDCLPPWDGSAVTIKGGCFMVPDWATMIDMRVGIYSVARLGVVGFRFASSVHPTANAALAAMRRIQARVLGLTAEEAFDPNTAVGVERRLWADPKELDRTRKPPGSGLPEPRLHPAYAVPDGYEVVTVLPLRQVEGNNISTLGKAVLNGHGPLPVAALHTSVPLEEPNLTPGTYILAYVPEVGVDEILELGATPPKRDIDRMGDLEKAREKAREAWKKKRAKVKDDVTRAMPDLSGIEIDPLKTREGILVVLDSENRGVGVIEVKNKVKLERHKDENNRVVLNLITRRLDLHFQVPTTRRGRSFLFTIPVAPIGDDGSLVREGYWDTEVEVKRPE